MSDPSQPGVLAADAVYTLYEVKTRLGMSDSGLREARRKGLKIHRLGKRGLVIGKELIDFIAEQPTSIRQG